MNRNKDAEMYRLLWLEERKEIKRLRDCLQQMADIEYVDALCLMPVEVRHLQNAAREALGASVTSDPVRSP